MPGEKSVSNNSDYPICSLDRVSKCHGEKRVTETDPETMDLAGHCTGCGVRYVAYTDDMQQRVHLWIKNAEIVRREILN